MASGPGVESNLREAERLIGEAAAAGAKLVALPENFALMGYRETDKLKAAEDDSGGPVQDFLAGAAANYGIVLVGGTVPLRGGDAGKVRAACPVYGPDGTRLGRYDKMHLFDVEVNPGEAYRESDTLEAGSGPLVVDTPVGRLGVAVCYDLRFPELFREMLLQGVELLAVPSAFTAVTGEAHWEVLVRARAVENLCYVIAPNQGGYHVNGRETFGGTMIVDPWGSVLARRDRGAGVVVAEVDIERQRGIRERFPVLTHRRLF